MSNHDVVVQHYGERVAVLRSGGHQRLDLTPEEARDLRNTLNALFPSAASTSTELPTPAEVYARFDPDHPSQASQVAGRPHPLPHGVQQAER